MSGLCMQVGYGKLYQEKNDFLVLKYHLLQSDLSYHNITIPGIVDM